MKCPHCKRSPVMLVCKECSSSCCCGCIQLEVHKCKGVAERKAKERLVLESKLPVVIGQKITKI